MKIGFLGLGDMGQAIVPRLIAAGHRVAGWNRTKEKAAPLLQIGMVWADTPREAARQSEVVFSIVTDSAAVRSLALGENGVITGLAKGAAYLDMSTIDPDASRAIAAEFAKAGLAMLDAPVSGTTLTVARGQASLMIAGDQAVFERVRPVLLAIGPKVTYIGAQGLAVQLKVALNMTLVVEVIGFCEGVALAEKGGVPREVAVDAFLKSVVASPVLNYRAPLLLEGHIADATYGNVNLQQKDMLLALELGCKLGLPVPLGAAANEMLNACRGLGLAHHDFVAVYEVYRRLGGMSQ
ncbi:MAG: NAD(P)-dependent oxidoreductase [Acidobacteria bacterium Pan2503]|uniref:NAD(P)-dependent oxidoreductase n=1 Tax=Candidatus Acidiferrum panamense TaxID=2741543 RepID=A0A7V8SXW2_9BACT|nr:NAD(P)-dependent oxidoreductase [Candidatus Acidoferrum panamensis]